MSITVYKGWILYFWRFHSPNSMHLASSRFVALSNNFRMFSSKFQRVLQLIATTTKTTKRFSHFGFLPIFQWSRVADRSCLQHTPTLATYSLAALFRSHAIFIFFCQYKRLSVSGLGGNFEISAAWALNEQWINWIKWKKGRGRDKTDRRQDAYTNFSRFFKKNRTLIHNTNAHLSKEKLPTSLSYFRIIRIFSTFSRV